MKTKEVGIGFMSKYLWNYRKKLMILAAIKEIKKPDDYWTTSDSER